MINSPRSTIVFNTFLLATGLFISSLVGCAATPPSEHANTKVAISNAKTTQAEQSNAGKTEQQILLQRQQRYAEAQKKLQTQARIEQLKKDQLQAHATKSAHSSTDPTQDEKQQTLTSKESPPHQQTLISNYKVGSGENLYSIAARPNTYNEGLLWTLIYKANRDQIKDPQQIFPGQNLTILHNHSDIEKETARETARKSGIFLH